MPGAIRPSILQTDVNRQPVTLKAFYFTQAAIESKHPKSYKTLQYYSAFVL